MATLAGGGLWLEAARPTIVNTLIYGNTATSKAGAIYGEYSSSPVLINVTIADNHANTTCGGVFFLGGQPLLTNTILWGNTAPTDPQIKLTASNPVLTCCDVEGGWEGVDLIDGDPSFLDPEGGDFRLGWLSPCINRGTNEGAPAVDFEGDARPAMGSCDMGYDEFSGVHALASSAFSLSRAAGGQVDFTLSCGALSGGRWYCLLGTRSGTVPGIPLPAGGAALPLNWDNFTNFVLAWLNSPRFTQFLGVLDAGGAATARLSLSPGEIPSAWTGKVMHYAFALDGPLNFASNPVVLEVEP